MKHSDKIEKKTKGKHEVTHHTDSKNPNSSKENGETSQPKKISTKSKRPHSLSFKITKTRTLTKTINLPISKTKCCTNELAEQCVKPRDSPKNDCDSNRSTEENNQSPLTNPQLRVDDQCFVETDEAMEWEPSESEVISTLHNIRRDYSRLKYSGKTIIPNCLNRCDSSTEAVVHVIIDTNILLSHLPTVKMLLQRNMFCKKIQIYIPWMVLQELDYMKTKNEKKNSIEILARKAASFLFEQIKVKNPCFRIQTLDEFKNCISLLSDENDDKILEWCLYLQKERQCKMILLSNDIMFCAKASASGIESMPKEQFIETLPQILDSKPSIVQANPVLENNHPTLKENTTKTYFLNNCDDSTFLSRFRQWMQVPLSYVLEYEMEAVFGDLWQKIVVVKPPWSLEDIVRCINKHWIAVFSFIYSKDFLQKFDHLNSLLKTANRCTSLPVHDRDTLVETGVCILQFIHRTRKQLQPHLKVALLRLEALKSSKQSTDSAVLEMFTSLWDRFNTTCGAIADAVNVSHSLERRSNSPIFSYKQAVDALGFMLPILVQMESTMSRFFQTTEPVDVILNEFSGWILCSMNRLELKTAISDSETLSLALVVFATDPQKRQLMTNGLSQLQMYLNLLQYASSKISLTQ